MTRFNQLIFVSRQISSLVLFGWYESPQPHQALVDKTEDSV